jgi:chromosome segregation ATPase
MEELAMFVQNKIERQRYRDRVKTERDHRSFLRHASEEIRQAREGLRQATAEVRQAREGLRQATEEVQQAREEVSKEREQLLEIGEIVGQSHLSDISETPEDAPAGIGCDTACRTAGPCEEIN